MNPADGCDPPRGSSAPEPRTWTAEQLAAFLEAVDDDPLHPLWHLLAMTGMRRGEALGLRWRDIDFTRSSLAVRQCLIAVGYEVRIVPPKTGRGRRAIALDPVTVSLLERHRRRSAARSRLRSDGALVFDDVSGRSLHPVAVSKRFATLVRQTGLPRIRLHDLRHTHATLALEAGVHPKVVSERLGHSTITLTLDVYSHALQHMQEEAAVRVADAVFNPAPTNARA